MLQPPELTKVLATNSQPKKKSMKSETEKQTQMSVDSQQWKMKYLQKKQELQTRSDPRAKVRVWG